jgi:hypothetical protein
VRRLLLPLPLLLLLLLLQEVPSENSRHVM